MNKLIISIFVVSIFSLSCKKEKAEEPEAPVTPPTAVLFATDVLPIFQQSCGTGGSCHGTSSSADGKVYETYAGANAVANAITLRAINHTGPHPMPQGGAKLSAEKIAKIESWINGGKKND